MKLRVVSVFGLATLQDEGRSGYRKFGVPVGGAFDKASFHAANEVLGNEAGATVVEFALGTLELEALEPGCLGVVGATEAVLVDGVSVGVNLAVEYKAGAKITVTPPKAGLRTYLSVPGGFVCEPVLGSASGAAVENGDVLSATHMQECAAGRLVQAPSSLSSRPLRVIPIGHDSWTAATYGVGRNLNRVGLRLDGPKPMIDAASGRSEPSVFGAVQLTEDRTLIIHGPDGPTIGGYKKIGCIVRADLDRVGQLAPGDEVQFLSVGDSG